MKELIKKTSFLILLLVAGFTSFSQDSIYSQRLLDRLYEAKNHSHIGLKTSEEAESHRACITMLLKEAKQNFSKLTASAQEVFSVLGARPSLSGTELTYSTTLFKIHYTKSGTDAVSLTDSDGDGIPNFVESMAAVFEEVYQKAIVDLGYSMPPADGTFGGDSKYDVYIQSIGTGYYGYVNEDDFVGNNPNSPQTEDAASTSYMTMNNNYSWVSGITELEAIKVTAAHEFFHAIQFGITTDCSGFFAESTAAWMEDIAYPGIDDNFQYMSSIFRTPDVALDFEDGEGGLSFDGHWYGGWLFWRYITDLYDVDFVRKIWIRAITEFEHDAYENELNAYGSDLRTTFNNWLVANEFVTNDAAKSPYTYDRGIDYGNYLNQKYSQRNVKREKTYSFTGNTINHVSNSAGNSRLTRLSADYFVITPNQNFTVSLKPLNKGKDFQLYLIKYNTGNSNFAIVKGTDLIDSIAFSVNDASSYNYFTIVVSRFDKDASIASEQYTLSMMKYKFVATGIESALDLNTTIYPNPASKEVIIDYATEQSAIMEVTDLSGKTMFSADLVINPSGKLPMDVSSWTPGVYIVLFKNQDGFIGRKRLVITR